MPVCVPIKDMRDTAKFSELVERTAGPVTVTKNGYSKFVVMRSEDYDAILADQAKMRLLERISRAESERAAGVSRDAFASIDEIARRHGI